MAARISLRAVISASGALGVRVRHRRVREGSALG
jgi:hypothetical protein